MPDRSVRGIHIAITQSRPERTNQQGGERWGNEE